MTAETPMDSAGKYVFIKELGRGAFGAVVLARNTKTGEQVAIKKMERAHLQVRAMEALGLGEKVAKEGGGAPASAVEQQTPAGCVVLVRLARQRVWYEGTSPASCSAAECVL